MSAVSSQATIDEPTHNQLISRTYRPLKVERQSSAVQPARTASTHSRPQTLAKRKTEFEHSLIRDAKRQRTVLLTMRKRRHCSLTTPNVRHCSPDDAKRQGLFGDNAKRQGTFGCQSQGYDRRTNTQPAYQPNLSPPQSRTAVLCRSAARTASTHSRPQTLAN